MRLLITAAVALIASGASAVTVPNGDFEAGNTDFTSGYNYGPNANDLSTLGEDTYSVVNNAQFSHSSFVSYGDHTTGEGLYLVGNAATTPGTPVYTSSSIAIVAGKTYTFGGFFSNAYPDSPAQIDFLVSLDGGPATSIGSYTIAAGAGVWNAASFTFYSGTATSAVLSFVDLNTAGGGNDFGIDDITLTAVPEPATWGLMIVGFSLVGFAARRRTAVTA